MIGGEINQSKEYNGKAIYINLPSYNLNNKIQKRDLWELPCLAK